MTGKPTARSPEAVELERREIYFVAWRLSAHCHRQLDPLETEAVRLIMHSYYSGAQFDGSAVEMIDKLAKKLMRIVPEVNVVFDKSGL